MPTAPEQFRLSVTASALSWKDEAGRAQIDGGVLAGVDVESRAGSFLAFRLSGGYGSTTATAAGPPGDGIPEVTDVNQYVIDLSAVLRLGLASLERAGVVPFGVAGLGAVVHDPAFEELVTKSQSAALFGGGVDFDFSDDFGARAEWRRYIVDAETLFDPADRTGNDRHADRFIASLYWKL
jgi:hypothetical protein